MWAKTFIVLNLIFQYIKAEDVSSYTAAVVEHASIKDSTPQNTILTNLDAYRMFAQQAMKQGADIIIFPEYGLTTLVLEDPEEYAIEVPNDTSPTVYQNKIIQELRAIAIEHDIYLVVNLLEKSNTTENRTLYYNTDLVFNQDGNIIAKYRKINLYNETKLTPGNETVTFQTNFGVTFGLFTCFDILFQNPSKNVLINDRVTDVIFPTAWFSTLPFYSSLSIQHGYATANGVNLLAANYNEPKNGNGGSGIYLANGTVAETFIDGSHSSKLIVQKIPKLESRSNKSSCSIVPASIIPTVPRGIFDKKNLSDYKTQIQFDSSKFHVKNIDLTQFDTTETICDDDFCCNFRFTIASANQSEYFKIVAFDGYIDSLPTIGEQHVRVCSLLFCETNNIDSCVTRQTPTTVFSKISVYGKLPDQNISFYQPVTLTSELIPVGDIAFCSYTTDNRTTSTVELSTFSQQSKVLVFGIYGRTSSGNQLQTSLFSFGLILVLVKYFMS